MIRGDAPNQIRIKLATLLDELGTCESLTRNTARSVSAVVITRAEWWSRPPRVVAARPFKPRSLHP